MNNYFILLDKLAPSCPENITAVIPEGQTSTAVTWNTFSGDTINMNLPVGNHQMSITAKDGTECHFLVSVTGSWHVAI
jgi:hypothetical protein